MFLEIITPDRKVFEGSVEKAIFPGKDGLLGVLNNHAPLVSTLKKGTVKLTDNASKTQEFKILGGVVEVNKNHVTLLADGIEKE